MLLVIARAIQGIAGVLLVPNSLALLESTFTGEARGAAVGHWASWSAVSTPVGLLLGDWIVDAASCSDLIAASRLSIRHRWVSRESSCSLRSPLWRIARTSLCTRMCAAATCRRARGRTCAPSSLTRSRCAVRRGGSLRATCGVQDAAQVRSQPRSTAIEYLECEYGELPQIACQEQPLLYSSRDERLAAHLTVANGNRDLELAVGGVKARRIVVTIKNRDCDPEKAKDNRHSSTYDEACCCYRSDTRRTDRINARSRLRSLARIPFVL